MQVYQVAYTYGALAVAALTNAGLVKDGLSFTITQAAVDRKRSSDQVQHIKRDAGCGTGPVEYVKVPGRKGIAASVPAISGPWDIIHVSAVKVGYDLLCLQFDTGSPGLWVFSNKQSKRQTTGHRIYHVDPEQTPIRESWSIEYADDSKAKGMIFEDKVALGDLIADKQAFAAATSVSQAFLGSSFKIADGILGLGFHSGETPVDERYPTFFENVMGTLVEDLFGVSFGEDGATYDFGWTNGSKYQDEPVYVLVDAFKRHGLWRFKGDKAWKFDHSSGVKSALGELGILVVDTGHTLIDMQPEIVTNYYRGIDGHDYGTVNDDGHSYFTIPCRTDMPDFIIDIAETSLNVPGNDMIWAFTDDTRLRCIGALQKRTEDFNTLGGIFLKVYYAIHDLTDEEEPLLGFSRLSHQTTVS